MEADKAEETTISELEVHKYV